MCSKSWLSLQWIEESYSTKSSKLILFAESLGGVESFIACPATQTHSGIPEEKRLCRGINDRLLRLSVRIEDVDDLICDMEQAMAGGIVSIGLDGENK